MAKEPIDFVRDIVLRAIEEEKRRPVAPYRDAEQLQRELDIRIPTRGKGLRQVLEMIEQVVRATPRTATRGFFNQLFGGRLWAATAADMLAAFLNNSMHTWKVAGAQVLIEIEVLRKMLRAVGFNRGEGAFTPGGSVSNMVAAMLARNAKFEDVRDLGLDGRRCVVYTSEESHYSITKNAGILGLGRRNVAKIPTDDRGRMDVDELRARITSDITAGAEPLLINATAGTTVLGAFDPLEEIGAAAAEYGVWYHIDAAWGGGALLSRRTRPLLEGRERADSFTWDAHKMMGVPLMASAVLLKREGLLDKGFAEDAPYLFQNADCRLDPGARSIQCGRRNDAFKVWAAWQLLGDEGYEARVDKLFGLARCAADRARRDSAFSLLMEPESLNVCFQVVGESSEAVCRALDERALVKVGHALFRGRSYIRLVCVDPEMTFADIDRFFDLVAAVAKNL